MTKSTRPLASIRALRSAVYAMLLCVCTDTLGASILDTLPPGQWYMAPNSNLSALDPCPSRDVQLCDYAGVGGQSEIMTAWSGGAYDTTRDRLLIWGGGHNDYGGNEIYAFDIATLTWSMVIGPTTPADRSEGRARNDNYYKVDGRPSSRHTANALVYAPNVDLFFSMATGATYGDPTGQGLDVDSFNFTTKTWKSNWIKSPGSIYGTNGTIAAYHPDTGKIWFHASFNSPLAAFDPNAAGGVGAWTTYASTFGEEQSAVLLDHKRNRLISMGSAGLRQFLVWDLNNPNVAPTRPVTSGHAGGQALESLSGAGFIYDPVGDRYIAWNGGRTVYALDPTTWVWSTVALDSSNSVTPTSAQSRGTYGRMRYIPSKHAFVVVNRTTENVYFFKLSSGSTPLPTVSLTASASNVAAGGSATLSWASTNATSCTASGAWTGTQATSGTQTLTNLTETATYTLTCSGPGGSGVQPLVIAVGTDGDAATLSADQNATGPMDVWSLLAALILWTLRQRSRFTARKFGNRI